MTPTPEEFLEAMGMELAPNTKPVDARPGAMREVVGASEGVKGPLPAEAVSELCL